MRRITLDELAAKLERYILPSTDYAWRAEDAGVQIGCKVIPVYGIDQQ
jgi:hypothetical protein